MPAMIGITGAIIAAAAVAQPQLEIWEIRPGTTTLATALATIEAKGETLKCKEKKGATICESAREFLSDKVTHPTVAGKSVRVRLVADMRQIVTEFSLTTLNSRWDFSAKAHEANEILAALTAKFGTPNSQSACSAEHLDQIVLCASWIEPTGPTLHVSYVAETASAESGWARQVIQITLKAHGINFDDL